MVAVVDFAAINARAEANKATHTQRMADKARAHFDAHPELTRGADGHTIDLDQRTGPRWWDCKALWKGWDAHRFLYVYIDENGDNSHADDEREDDEHWAFGRFEADAGRSRTGKRMTLKRPTEKEAFINLARHTKLITHETYDSALASITRDALEEDRAERAIYHEAPLYWVHEQRGLIVDFVPTDDKKLPLIPVLKKREAKPAAA